jgi:hypothetical protein
MADLKQPLPPASAPATGPGGLPTVGQQMWQKQAHDLLAQINDILSNNVFDWPVLKESGNEVLTVANIGTGAGKVVALDGSAKLPAVDGSQLTGIAQSGRLVAGTPLVQNPLSMVANVTQAHGLGTIPFFMQRVLECLSAELNYSVGDKVFEQNYFWPVSVFADATNVIFIPANNPPQLVNKTTNALTAIVQTKWKLTITPYKLT